MTALAVFSKLPDNSQAKTRLRSSLSECFVQELHRAFVADTLLASKEADFSVRICFWLPTPGPEIVSRFPTFLHESQDGDSFPDRFQSACEVGMQAGKGLVICGSDSPLLSVNLLNAAIDAVRRGRVVIGPNQNGGFYLLGLPIDCELPDLRTCFTGPSDFFAVRDSFPENQVEILSAIPDVDTRKDLELLYQELKRRSLDSTDCYIPPATWKTLLSHAQLFS